MKDQITKMGKECKKGLAKHGLNIKKVDKTKNLIFCLVKVRAYGLKREREKKKRRRRRKKRRREVQEKQRYGTLYGIYISLEHLLGMELP